MGVLDKLGGLLGGGLGSKIADIVGSKIENKAEAENLRLQIEQAIGQRAHELQLAELEADRETERMFNERTIAMEGTASDLKSVPVLGAIVLFLRGAYRPLFAYFVAYLDFVYFVTGMAWTETQESLLFAINMLVIGFFFGERAAKNVLPLLAQAFASKAQEQNSAKT